MKRSLIRIVGLDAKMRAYSSSNASDGSDGIKSGQEWLKGKISQIKLSKGFIDIESKMNIHSGFNSLKTFPHAQAVASASPNIDDDFMDFLKQKNDMIPKEVF